MAGLVALGFVAGALAVGAMTLLLRPQAPPRVEPIELSLPAERDRAEERRDRVEERRDRAERRRAERR
ncbi:MAG: hypothetical protein ACRDL4_18635, partial [Thermoleophilaceae bacterium]